MDENWIFGKIFMLAIVYSVFIGGVVILIGILFNLVLVGIV